MFYHEFDYLNPNPKKYFYDYISSLDHEYALGVAWDKDQSPVFCIEKIESVCVDPGSYWEPPFYEPEPVESIIVRPRLKYPKR